MRDILFRGKRVDNGEWIEGLIVKLFDEEHGNCTVIVPIDTTSYRFELEGGEYVDPETVGQWTGLVDKDGKMIFEGDVLDTSRWVVTYCSNVNEGYEMNTGWYVQRDNFESWTELTNTTEYVVLGNIHDNPELVERR